MPDPLYVAGNIVCMHCMVEISGTVRTWMASFLILHCHCHISQISKWRMTITPGCMLQMQLQILRILCLRNLKARHSRGSDFWSPYWSLPLLEGYFLSPLVPPSFGGLVPFRLEGLIFDLPPFFGEPDIGVPSDVLSDHEGARYPPWPSFGGPGV